MKPKYQQVANLIRNRIQQNTYKGDSFLPSQKELLKEFNVSKTTLQRALSELSMEGLIYSKRGYGTKIVNSDYWNNSNEKNNQYENLASQFKKGSQNLSNTMISFGVELSNAEISENLQIPKHSPVFFIYRLRQINKKPYCLEKAYIPVELAPHLTEEICQVSIFDYLKNNLNYDFAGAFRIFSADIVNEDDQKFLNSKQNEATFVIKETTYLTKGKPIEYSISRSNYKTRTYVVREVKH